MQLRSCMGWGFIGSTKTVAKKTGILSFLGLPFFVGGIVPAFLWAALLPLFCGWHCSIAHSPRSGWSMGCTTAACLVPTRWRDLSAVLCNKWWHAATCDIELLGGSGARPDSDTNIEAERESDENIGPDLYGHYEPSGDASLLSLDESRLYLASSLSMARM